jgi:hypothetical protein
LEAISKAGGAKVTVGYPADHLKVRMSDEIGGATASALIHDVGTFEDYGDE